MQKQEILYLILGIALGAIFTSILFLRIPLVVQKAHELGIQKVEKSSFPERGIRTPNF